ncbi:hypothetical protein A1507_20260 [Methylomonas koyamae]|uniref:Uncharacterized protein n=1 Tax=Methylomonas koyamae TaxID=702114 RepID=A0A177N2W2_9GAMM|nr:hypothetical protein A1507_20260 [Methylomonas koyamae]
MKTAEHLADLTNAGYIDDLSKQSDIARHNFASKFFHRQRWIALVNHTVAIRAQRNQILFRIDHVTILYRM